MAKYDAYRRDVMKALGAGTALTVVGGSAAARDDAGGARDRRRTSIQEGEADQGSVYTVETLIRGPPTNPDRPADFFYQPTGISVDPGDVLRFRFTTPDHNVVTYHPAFGMRRRVPTGVGAVSSPLLGWRPDSIPDDQVEPPAEPGGGEDGDGANGDDEDGDSEGEGGDDAGSQDGPVPNTWLVTFETPGVYDLCCSPHETFGMAMRVVVGGETEAPFETSDPEALPEPRAGPVGLARTTLTDPALRPDIIVDSGMVLWESLEANQGDGS